MAPSPLTWPPAGTVGDASARPPLTTPVSTDRHGRPRGAVPGLAHR